MDDADTYEGPPSGDQCGNSDAADLPHGVTHESILTRLDELLGDSGGAYSQTAMPIERAIQYSAIALNRQTHDALMRLVQVLAATVVGRVQYCEALMDKMAAPWRRTIRGRNKRSENALGSLCGVLANAVCARVAYGQTMLADCQCRMLGASDPGSETPLDGDDTGMSPSAPVPVLSAGAGATAEPLSEYARADGELLAQWLPRILHAMRTKSSQSSQCCSEIETSINAEAMRLYLIASQPDGEQKLLDEFNARDVDLDLTPYDHQFEEHPIDIEHYPIEATE